MMSSESKTSGDFLCSDNAHYSNFFVLKLGVYTDGQPMKLNSSDGSLKLNSSDGSLELSIPSQQAANVVLSIDSVAK